MADERDQLDRLWRAHLELPFPSEWHRLVDRFGEADERSEAQSLPDADRIERAWGSPDLILYDSYVAGLVTQVLGSSKAGHDVIGEHEPDQRLEVYLDACAGDARDDETREEIKVCRDYLGRLNRMPDLARRVPRK